MGYASRKGREGRKVLMGGDGEEVTIFTIQCVKFTVKPLFKTKERKICLEKPRFRPKPLSQ